MIYEVRGTNKIAALFDGWQETTIWSCLQGVMGHLYADSKECPKSAMALLGDFCYFAGTPDRELAAYRPKQSKGDFMIMTARQPQWFALIEEIYGKQAKKFSRYAMKKEADIFDRKKLWSYAAAPGGDIRLQLIDRELFLRCREQSWSRDLTAQYADYEEYRDKGLGVAALKNGELVSGASSYSSYRGGIEIEIDTKEEFRRQGLAAACGARLILECLERGLYPSWDAHNLQSVSLAQKLGYHLDHAYTAYEIREFEERL